MDLDETWQVGLRPEKTKPCTFPAKSHCGFRREREKMGRRGVVFLSGRRRTTSATFLGSISAKLSTFHEQCPGGGSRHMVSHSRKVSIKGSNFPKNRLFMVLSGTLFVLSLRVTGNVLRCLHSFHPLVDIPRIYPSWVTFAEGCTVFQLSTSDSHPFPQYQQWRNRPIIFSNMTRQVAP